MKRWAAAAMGNLVKVDRNAGAVSTSAQVEALVVHSPTRDEATSAVLAWARKRWPADDGWTVAAGVCEIEDAGR